MAFFATSGFSGIDSGIDSGKVLWLPCLSRAQSRRTHDCDAVLSGDNYEGRFEQLHGPLGRPGMGDSGSILASPGCPLGPQQPPNRRPHARRDRHPRQLRRQLPRRDSRRGCVCSMRLDYAFGFSAVV